MYNLALRKFIFNPAAVAVLLILGPSVRAQQVQQPLGSAQPKVRVNYLNVCSPSAEDRQQIAGALERISANPKFAVDFEVARGRSTLSSSDLLMQNAEPPVGEGSVSDWIRIRREFPAASSFVSAQYSFSMNQGSVVETRTFRTR